MQEWDLRDTIAAISTPAGHGGLGIVRLSGKKALAVAGKIFRPRKAEPKSFPPRRAIFGRIVDPRTGAEVDEAFLLYFRAPRSYTRQDVVEFSLHGSPAVLEEVVRMAVHAGARPALPGEFTLRAYLNGRIDLPQAEAVNDLIRAETMRQARLAYSQVRGSLSAAFQALKACFIELQADVEASLEFPDERLEISDAAVKARLDELAIRLRRLIQSYEYGKALHEGLTLAIVGRTNVGKSTIFNALLAEPRAIVAPRAGTTRDFIKETLRIGDAGFNLVDMAGLGRPGSSVEAEGMRRARDAAARADGVLFIFDLSRPENADDRALLREYGEKKALLIFNKGDLPRKMRPDKLKALRPGTPSIEISAIREADIRHLRKALGERYLIRHKGAEDVIFHLRQKLVLEDALSFLNRAAVHLTAGSGAEIAAEDLRSAVSAIGRLTGGSTPDDVFKSVFSRFCVGK